MIHKKKSNWFLQYIILPVFISIVACLALWYQISYHPFVKQDININIEHGDGSIRFCNKIITQEEAISYLDKKIFCIYSRIYDVIQKKPYSIGSRTFSVGTTMLQIWKSITTQQMHKIVFPEGLTVYEMMQILASDKQTKGDIPANIQEGSLMPDTYVIANGSSKESVVREMQSAMEKFLLQEWNRRDPNIALQNPAQALILASMIEAEAFNHVDRKFIASVFLNRIAKKMRLQSDPTIAYAMSDGKYLHYSNKNTRTYFKYLEIQSPHNTYRNYGLPPTAICNPSKHSIVAAMQPAKTDFLFFIGDNDGKVIFTKDFKTHVKIKNKQFVPSEEYFIPSNEQQ